MRDYFKPKTWLIATLILAMGFVLSLVTAVYYEFIDQKNIPISRASSNDNVSGYAWNANTGWISFNCTNDNSCATSNYGVSLDKATGDFSGSAWSSSLGWISFNRGETGDPPDNPYKNGTFLAHYNSNNGEVDGWVKILSLGGEGWVKLRKSGGDGGGNYGVSVDSASGDFSGWAWNGNDAAGGSSGLGWISFNCLGESPACNGTNYKVTALLNDPPTAANLTAPHWSYAQAALSGALRANLQFDFIDGDAGSFGSAYQVVIVEKLSNTTVLDTGKCTGFNIPSANCRIDNSVCLQNGAAGCHNPGDCVCQYPANSAELVYDTAYKWLVKVWDNHDASSSLVNYDTPSDTDNDDNFRFTFTTYKHEFPDASAVFFTAEPSRAEKVKFTGSSQTYLSAAPATAVPCDPSRCSWFWTVPGTATINNTATLTPIVTFNSAGSNSVKFKVTDLIDGYWTEITIPVMVNAKLPNWKEVKPQ